MKGRGTQTADTVPTKQMELYYAAHLAIPPRCGGRDCRSAVIFGSPSSGQAWKKESLELDEPWKRRCARSMRSISRPCGRRFALSGAAHIGYRQSARLRFDRTCVSPGEATARIAKVASRHSRELRLQLTRDLGRRGR